MTNSHIYTSHKNLDKIKKIVAIGGGHGLGRVMSGIGFMEERLTAIVATTDNGGSTGRFVENKAVLRGEIYVIVQSKSLLNPAQPLHYLNTVFW